MTYPSVTTVLGPWADFSGIPESVLNHAAARGTEVHRACELYAKGGFPITDAECRGYVDSFKGWFDLAVAEVAATEIELVSESFQFMGHPDLICRIAGDKFLTIVDYKTPVTVSPLWRAQLTAYRYLAVQNGYDVRRAMALRLKRDGSKPIITEYPNSKYRDDLKAFMNALGAYHAFGVKEKK